MNAIAQRLRISFRPALIHLGISALIAMLAMLVIFQVWYPAPLSDLQGVDRLVLIMIGVDVVIGPLITLIVYNPAKKSLRFDLGVIAMLQTLALLYGLQAIYDGRPAYVVFSVDRFEVVPVQDVNQDSLGRTAAEFQPSFWRPATVAARMPDDPEKRSDVLFSSISGGADLAQLPEYYVALDAERAAMLARLRPMEELRKLNELDDAAWAALLASFGKQTPTELELGYLPVSGNVKDGAMILDAQTGEVLGMRLLIPSYAALKKPPGDAPTPVAPATQTEPAPASSPAPETPSPAPSPRPMASPGVG
ncbi:TfpX/TfpZ family type IV pilin accessory protein [Panacagrimonas sp.]|uniref:TfpX/TfpZ family type IV pilin accessory protein n=1 Tax=Panacagrimonas sp. TaxID=2480088 RepID=UPI003B515FD5